MITTEKKINKTLPTDLSQIFQFKVSIKEIEALNRCDRKVRYQYVMKRIADTETLWTMVKNPYTVIIQLHDGIGLFPVWSSREYGMAFCEKTQPEYDCLPISLNDFVDYFIDFICEEDLLLNVFPTINEPIGKVVNINDFACYLGKELEDYQ